jgi:1-acyl-sn-glycerol-3-phosphate acyltransferase
MIRGLLLVCYLLIRFLAGDLRLGWWKLSGAAPRPRPSTHRPSGTQDRERRLRAAVSLFMLREGRRVIRRAGELTGFSVVTESALPDLPPLFVLVCNHQSLLDIPVLISTLPGRTLKFIAKRSLKYGVPLVSKCLRYGGDALIVRPRGRIDTAQTRLLVRELRRFAALADEGACPVIFADGSRSRDGAVHRFHTGGLATVLERRPLPIVTAAIDGGYRLRGLTGLARMGTTRYRVKFLSVYQPPDNKGELRTLVQRMHTEIAAQIDRWRRETPVLTPG